MLRQRRPADPGRPPVAHGPGGGRRGDGAGRRRRRPRRLRGAVGAHGQATRPSRPRRRVRRRAGPRHPLRHPPHVRAAVDQGHPHGRVGERAPAPAHGLGAGLRRRAPPVLHAVRLRRVRPVPAAEGRSCSSRAAAGSATGSTASTPSTATPPSASGCRSQHPPSYYFQRAVLDQLRPRRARPSRPWPSASAPTGSCGRRTSRTPTTPPSTSSTSTSWSAASPRPTAASSWATTAGSCSRSRC